MNKLLTTLPKWLILALTAGVGCFVTALICGEPFLAFTYKPVPPPKPIVSQSVVLTIDVSGSMSGNKLTEVKRAAVNFINRCNLQQNKIAVVSFSSGAQIVSSFSQNANQLIPAINGLTDGGGTSFYYAMQKSQEVIQNESAEKNILLFTDGQSTDMIPSSATNIATTLRSQGVKIVAIGTNDADAGFLSSLTGDSKLVVSTQDGQFEQAFAQAEQLIYSKGLMDSGGAYSFKETLIRVCVWTAFLCFGIALFIKLIQNQLMQRKKIIRVSNIIAIFVATAIVGILAGGSGQVLFGIFSSVGLQHVDRLFAWALLGGVSAYGLALFIPNLNKNWAWKGGVFGGILGATAFVYLTQILGDVGGRLTGAFILGFCIGLMVGVIETVCRDAFLKINFSGNESTTINLGEQPVSLGSGCNDTVYVSGVAENAMSFQLNRGKFICYKNSSSQNVNIGDKLTLGNVTIEVCGNNKPVHQ